MNFKHKLDLPPTVAKPVLVVLMNELAAVQGN